ncbi:MAG: hypothetical protein ABI373_06950, partial [Flavobacteriales bacterium]
TGDALLALDRWTPSVRGGGFSLMLAPVMLFGPTTAFLFTLLLAASLVAFGLLYRKYLSALFPPLTATLMVLALCYNSTVLSMKLDLTPEFPFTVLSLVICLAVRDRRSGYLLVGVLAGLLVSFKLLGLAMLPALVLGWCWREEDLRSRFIASAKVVLAAITVFFAIQHLATGSFGLDNVLWYQKPFTGEELPGSNLEYYQGVVMYFFVQHVANWVNNTLAIVTEIGFCIGLMVGIRRRWTVETLYTMAYLAVLLAYPYRGGGMRFLFPIMPFLFVAVARGFSKVLLWIRIRSTQATAVYWIVLLLTYWVNFQNTVNDQPPRIVGPDSAEAAEALAWLKGDKDVVVMCTKPWMVHYCTGLTAMPVVPLGELPSDLSESRELLYLKAKPDEVYLGHYAQLGQGQLDLPGSIIRENANFELIRLNR